jgi:hypothetical protein
MLVMMKSRQLLALALSAPTFAVGLWACVGDSPSNLGAPQDGQGQDAATNPTGQDGSMPGNDSGTPGTNDSGDADAGPRCDPTKPFNEVERLKGISTADDERDVWVSKDELTAYVAVTPAAGGASKILKSVRTAVGLDFSAPTAANELNTINMASTAIPSLTADGLVLVYTQTSGTQGIYVSVRGSTTETFPAGVAPRSRANPFGLGDPFIAPAGESLLVARDNGVNGLDIDEAPRDVGGIYGDGGFVDYAVAPDVTNVNDDTADDRRPVFSADRLTLVFASNRAPGANANTDLYISERAGIGGTFTVSTRLAEPISSDASDRPGTISADGCLLYFTSARAGGFGVHDVYIAKRGK